MDGDVTDAGKRQIVRMTREATLLQRVCGKENAKRYATGRASRWS